MSRKSFCLSNANRFLGVDKTCGCFSLSISVDDKAFNLPEEDVLSSVEELMSYIEKCLAKHPADERAEESTSGVDFTASGRVVSLINNGGHLLEKVLKRCKRRAFKNGETRKVVIDVLKEASQIRWSGAGLSVVAFVLQNVDNEWPSETAQPTNKKECNELLRYMYGLAKQLNQLKRHIPEEKLHDVAEFIFTGSFFCVSQMQSNKLSRLCSSVVHAEAIKSLQSELSYKYEDLKLEAVMQLLEIDTQRVEALNQMSTVLPPSQRKQPDAVGIDEARATVRELLDLKDEKPRGVVLYGIGGIGKTTLATAVFTSLDLHVYKHCRINIQQDCSESDVKQLQEQILRDLFNQKIQLMDSEEGKTKLSNLFKEESTQPLFLYIDNALRGNDLAKFLPPDISSLRDGSRILITTRNLDETDIIEERGIKRYAYCVNSLPYEESNKLLCWKALGGDEKFFDQRLDIDGLVKVCGGVPLVLEMVGSKLRNLGDNVRACERTIEFLKDTLDKGEGDLSEKMVDVVYNTRNMMYTKMHFLI